MRHNYPDSRWLSNISHELTHVKVIPNNMAFSKDFKLGWLIHCLYDQIQNELQQTLPIPLDIISEDIWILYSALKVIAGYERCEVYGVC